MFPFCLWDTRRTHNNKILLSATFALHPKLIASRAANSSKTSFRVFRGRLIFRPLKHFLCVDGEYAQDIYYNTGPAYGDVYSINVRFLEEVGKEHPPALTLVWLYCATGEENVDVQSLSKRIHLPLFFFSFLFF